MVSNAAKQFIEDCGGDNVLRIAKAMLITNRTVCISDSIDITWILMPEGIAWRECVGEVTVYHRDGNIAFPLN